MWWVTHLSNAHPLSDSKGLFTSTNPETRRVVVDSDGRVKVKVVYVVLEAQYQSALSATVKRINSTNKQVQCIEPLLSRSGFSRVLHSQVCFEIVGYLLEELRDSTNFEAFKKDVADANVFIGSLIFIEELADKV